MCVKGVTGVKCLCKDCVEQKNLLEVTNGKEANGRRNIE